MSKIKNPRVTFNQLRTLESVVRLGSVTQAAQELHVSQPTVSAQIQELQSSLGCALVQPAGRGIQATEAAQLLREAALDMFDRWQQFEEELQQLEGLERGVLRIAGVTTTEYFIAPWLKRYADSHPNIELELVVENRDAVVHHLQQQTTELAVMMMPPEHMALNVVPFMPNPLVLVGPVGHPWAAERKVRKQALEGQPLLMRESGSGTRLATEAFLRSNQLRPVVKATLGSNEAIKHAVAAGLGLAVVSSHALGKQPERDGLTVLPVVGFPLQRQWSLVWRKDRVLSLAARRFVDNVRAGAVEAAVSGVDA